jgi:hypothetical protein
MTSTRSPRAALTAVTALAALAMALLAPPPAALGQASPRPGGGSAPPRAWRTAVCTALDRLDLARGSVALVGRAALVEDIDVMTAEAIRAGLLADRALTALDAIEDDWGPGTELVGFLVGTSLALLDLGGGLAEAEPYDPVATMAALGSVTQAWDGWERARAELDALEADGSLDCAAVPVPSLEPIPVPSFVPDPSAAPEPLGDAELEARFPSEIAGEPVTPDSITGPELLAQADPDDPEGQAGFDALAAFLADNGRTMDDLSVGFAFLPTEDELGATITAFRVRGSDAAALLEGLVPLITMDYGDPQRGTVTVGDRELVRVSDGPYDPEGIYEVLYPRGDVVWAVSATDPLLSEILAALG